MAPETSLPSFDLKRNYQRIRDEIGNAIESVLESQHFILGPEVERFEEEIAMYLGTPHAIGCASGSDALLLALMALDTGPGDEVITTPYSFFATASCITRLGAKPVFVDVDPKTYNISPAEVEKAITEKTRAILPVHLFGQMARVEDLLSIAEKREIPIVEDAAQAIGAARFLDGRPVKAGTVGTIGCFSFFPTKNLGAYGDGGLVTTSSKELASRLSRLRVHGAGEQYMHEEVGINSRLDALQAAVLRVRLRHLETWNTERRRAAGRYRLLFAEMNLENVVSIPEEETGNHHTYHQYVLRCEKRDELQNFLKERGIVTRVYYPRPLHLQTCFMSLGYAPGDFPVSEALSRETLALPMFPEILPEEQERVVAEIARFYKKSD
ncbi:MAG TPA: transcriptional regulator [Synergistaceae bacterium]|jgi:dTDP-4-amino-4,6-dideoxygalactose transaminase|nr:transcriptional regulator [Synergistaceae bacterium]